MIENMQLADILAILGRVGTVTLRKGTNDVSATPGHAADTEGWSCELVIDGYLSPYSDGCGGSQQTISRRGNTRGLSATDAAKHTLFELERFLASEKAAVARECYLRWGNHRNGVKPEAKINWGDE